MSPRRPSELEAFVAIMDAGVVTCAQPSSKAMKLRDHMESCDHMNMKKTAESTLPSQIIDPVSRSVDDAATHASADTSPREQHRVLPLAHEASSARPKTRAELVSIRPSRSITGITGRAGEHPTISISSTYAQRYESGSLSWSCTRYRPWPHHSLPVTLTHWAVRSCR